MEKNMTMEDYQALNECRREGFRYRSIPLIVMGFGFLAYRQFTGKMKTSSYLGIATQYIGVAFLGNIIGHMSYKKQCRDKILQLDDSYLKRFYEEEDRAIYKDKRNFPSTDDKNIEELFEDTTYEGLRNHYRNKRKVDGGDDDKYKL